MAQAFTLIFVVSKTKYLIRIDAKAVEPLIANYYTGQIQSLDYLEWRYDFSAYKHFDLDATEGITNHAYNVFYQAYVNQKEHQLLTTISSSCSSYLVMYSAPNKSFVALEPQMHAVNAINLPYKTGLTLLTKGQSLTYTCKIKVENGVVSL